jgi:hypothetical protein
MCEQEMDSVDSALEQLDSELPDSGAGIEH